MTTNVIWPAKLQGETALGVFDFAGQVGFGATIEDATTQIEVFNGVDTAAEDVFVGAPTISGDQIKQMLTGGVTGVTYVVTAFAACSDDQVLSQQAYLAVLAPAIET